MLNSIACVKVDAKLMNKSKPTIETTKQSTQNENAQSKDEEINALIWKWVDKVIIGENFCPFAKMPREQNRVKLKVTEATNVDTLLSVVIAECKVLDENPNIETTLVACSYALHDFEEYLDTLAMAQQLLEDMDYEGIYQLASFHPNYLFDGEPSQSASHYTNRAPLPIFHLIREDSISKALSFVDEPEAIFERNIEHANKLGKAFFQPFLASK